MHQNIEIARHGVGFESEMNGFSDILAFGWFIERINRLIVMNH